jgi:hypothetical protein
MSLLETIHGRYVHMQRVRVLGDHFVQLSCKTPMSWMRAVAMAYWPI